MMEVQTGLRNFTDMATDGNPAEAIVSLSDAEPNDVLHVLEADSMANDGHARSQWVWVRFPNGDLMLATFPQDDTYFAVADKTGAWNAEGKVT